MNNILEGFLLISPQESQLIVKRIENFVKNVRINNIEDDDDDLEHEEDSDYRELNKRSTSALKEKFRRNREGYTYLIIILVSVWVILESYFVIYFIVLKDYQANLVSFMKINNSTQNNIISQRMLSIGIK